MSSLDVDQFIMVFVKLLIQQQLFFTSIQYILIKIIAMY